MTADEKIHLPGGLQETALLPLARYKFSTWVHFNNRDALPQLERDAQNALERLGGLMPQRQQARRVMRGGL